MTSRPWSKASRVEKILCSPRITASLLRRVGALAAELRGPSPNASLTAREVEVAELLDQGLSNKEIGQRLNIAVPTVKNHVHSILEKLHVHRRAEAAARLEVGTRTHQRGGPVLRRRIPAK